MNIYPSKSLPFEPFVYLIGWSHLNKFYIGCRYGKTLNAHPSQLWSTYFTSSKYVKEFREINGEPDLIRIEKTFSNPEKCFSYEQKLLTRMKITKDIRFLNKSIAGVKFTNGPHSEETKLKMSESAKNIPKEIREKINNTRKPASEETRSKLRRPKSDAAKQKMKDSWKNRKPTSDETKLKMSISAKNKPPVSEETRKKHSEISKNQSTETRQKISDTCKGRVHSEETRRQMSESAKNRWLRKKQELNCNLIS